jgi:protein-tyrosine phosphatase
MDLFAQFFSLSARIGPAVARHDMPCDGRRSRRTFLKGAASAALAGVGGVLLSACGGGTGAETSPTPRLASVENFRDVGGPNTGYPTIDGKLVRRGVFYRSSVLTVSAADRAALDALGIAEVYDLRTPGEIARTADSLPVGAGYRTINVTGADDVALPAYDTAADAIAAMERAQRDYVLGAAQREGFGALLAQLAQTPGAQLVHSSAGKDRAGWAAALLLSIANVPFDVIMQDYLLSNTYAAASMRARIAAVAAQSGPAAAQAETPVFTVQPSFLQVAFDQVHETFGTMNAYLMQGLGLSQDSIDRLHDRLVA